MRRSLEMSSSTHDGGGGATRAGVAASSSADIHWVLARSAAALTKAKDCRTPYYQLRPGRVSIAPPAAGGDGRQQLSGPFTNLVANDRDYLNASDSVGPLTSEPT